MNFLFVASLLVSTAFAQQDESLTRYLRAQGYRLSLDPSTVVLKDDSDAEHVVDHRKFVRYESSKWEQLWLDNVNDWAEKKVICEELNKPLQMEYMHDFLTLLCSARYEAPYNAWCIIDDEDRPLWYNTADRSKYDLHWIKPFPDSVALTSPFQPVIPGPEHDHIVSKMIFRDEETGTLYTEYIEPLVSHLRFPLCKCANFVPVGDPRYHWHSIIFKGYILPPPPAMKVNKKFYFDAGASQWIGDTKGGSLKFFNDMWKRSGHVFDGIYAFEYSVPIESFMDTIPEHAKNRMHYQQCMVVSTPEEETAESPFLPSAIKRVATAADYVLFKLDIDSPKVEVGSINYILNDPNNFIDEIAFEHHIGGNYLMEEWGMASSDNKETLLESYELFLKLRQVGIRAHSWI